MRLLHVRLLPMVIGLGLISAQGCCQKEKATIGDLKANLRTIGEENRDLRDELARQQNLATDAQREADRLRMDLADKRDAIRSLEAQLAGRLSDPGEDTPAPGWERGLVGDRVTVTTDVLFGSGRAKLTSSGQATLNKIVTQLKSQYAGLPVRVYGFCDSDPIRKSKELWADNLDLSANRAMAVTRYLRDKGIAKDDIETVAMGATNFIAPNRTPKGKAKNRRVEIVVIRK